VSRTHGQMLSMPTLIRIVVCCLMVAAQHCWATTTLSLAHIYAPDHPTAKACDLFAEKVWKNSSGRLAVKVFEASSAGNQTPLIRSLANGSLDFSVLAQGVVGSVVPEFNALGLPYLFPDEDTAWRVLDGKIGEQLKEKAAAAGFIVLGFWNIDVRHFSNSKRPIKKPADMVGLKLRNPPDQMTIDVISALGATPHEINFSDLYKALQQGEVDGQDNPLVNYQSMRFYEVQKYLSLTGHKFSIHSFLMSKFSWEALPEVDRQIVQDAAKEALRYYRLITKDDDANLYRDLQARGVRIDKVDVAPFKAATASVYDKWYASPVGDFVRSVVQAVRGEE